MIAKHTDFIYWEKLIQRLLLFWKRMMFLTMLVAGVSTLSSAFVTSYTAFLVTRVFAGFGTLGTFVSMCILAVEITSAKHKSLVGR